MRVVCCLVALFFFVPFAFLRHGGVLRETRLKYPLLPRGVGDLLCPPSSLVLSHIEDNVHLGHGGRKCHDFYMHPFV